MSITCAVCKKDVSPLVFLLEQVLYEPSLFLSQITELPA